MKVKMIQMAMLMVFVMSIVYMTQIQILSQVSFGFIRKYNI